MSDLPSTFLSTAYTNAATRILIRALEDIERYMLEQLQNETVSLIFSV